MKLLMVARRVPPDVRSGTETVFQSLYERAQGRHEVRLVVGFRRDRALVPAEAVAVDLRGLDSAAAWGRMWWAARREARRFKPDACLANSIEAPAIGAPTVCIVHDLNFGVASRSVGVRAREVFYALKSRALAQVVAVSDATRDHLISVGVPAKKITVISNGVDLERFKPFTRPDDGLVRFVYAGRMLPSKGQHLALDALARLPASLKARARLTLVGAADDPIFVDQLKLQAWGQPVELLTDVADIAPYVQQADVALFPTLMREGFGYTAIEAMACGKPVIWSDQPAIREATAGIGLPVPQGDVEAMRAAMRRLMEDPALAASIGAEGRRLVEARYDWAAVWARYEALLLSLR